MTLPNFLIVGSMKCGTTTVYRDLENSPGVFFPIDKEPGHLADDAVLERGPVRESYEALFARAGSDQRRGEASTAYTKRPSVEDVAGRAAQILGDDPKIIYIVREPVARVISQHHHDFTEGHCGGSIDEAVRNYPPLIDYTRYAWQIGPWIERFGRERVRILLFQEYTADREAGAAELFEFLGVEPGEVDTGKVFNRSETKHVLKGVWSAIYHAPVYRKVLRPLVPRGFKEWVFRVFLPKAPPRPDPPTPETVRYILDTVREDHAELAEIMGRDAPLWDEARTIEKHERLHAEHAARASQPR